MPTARARSRPLLAATLGLGAGALLLLTPLPVAAQSPEGFLLRRPHASIGLRFGYSVPRAESDIFDFTRNELTVEKSDFRSPYIGGEVAVRVNERLDVSLAGGYAGSKTRSEFRDWVDTDDLPIEQETEFAVAPVTLAVKGYLYDRGRSIGRFAWVPATWSPYVGVGAGWTWYRFKQVGDFVDFESLDIFTARFTTDGWAPTAHVLAGVEYSLSPRWVVTGEGRYGWASGEMSGHFVDFDDMDLTGFQATVGISARF